MSVEHTITYCRTCNCVTVICGTCGNNACNGSSGYAVYENCDCDCSDAYEFWRGTDFDRIFQRWLDINIGDNKTNPYWDER